MYYDVSVAIKYSVYCILYLVQFESITIHKKHRKGYCADSCLGCEVMLFWDKRNTFLIL